MSHNAKCKMSLLYISLIQTHRQIPKPFSIIGLIMSTEQMARCGTSGTYKFAASSIHLYVIYKNALMLSLCTQAAHTMWAECKCDCFSFFWMHHVHKIYDRWTIASESIYYEHQRYATRVSLRSHHLHLLAPACQHAQTWRYFTDRELMCSSAACMLSLVRLIFKK